MNRFGEKLRILRKREGMSQRKLAATPGVYYSYISRIEKETKPSIAIILKISELFKVSTDVLMKDHLELEDE